MINPYLTVMNTLPRKVQFHLRWCNGHPDRCLFCQLIKNYIEDLLNWERLKLPQI